MHRNELDRRKQFGVTLKYFREKRNISFNKVALELLGFNGVTPLIENERCRRHPTLQTLRKIGDALQFTTAEPSELEGLVG
jgi:transcriptional regulator with XRE-family HTH domain